MEPEENNYDPRLVTKLTPYNWTTEFKEAFLELALNYGQDIMIPDPGNYDDVVNSVRRYPETAEGFRTYEAIEKRYSRLKENKKKLISKLLGAMEREVKDKVTSQPGHANAYNILEIWNMTEQVCVGRGTISVYTLITKLLRTTQWEGYQRFAKEFKKTVADLKRQGGPRQPLVQGQAAHPDTVILEKIFNTIFILRLNQERFKEKLTTIYGQQNWPDYEALSQELNMYTEATERMEMPTNGKSNNDEIIGAHMGKVETTMECWNCGSKKHIIKSNCPRPPHKCSVCKKAGTWRSIALKRKTAI
jgi:hypothetical protein